MAISTTYLGTVESGSALITVPVESAPIAYLPIDARIELFANSLATFIPGLVEGLRSVSATLADGKPVETAADAVRWCVEQIAAATGA